jgi:hypothetical protein
VKSGAYASTYSKILGAGQNESWTGAKVYELIARKNGNFGPL